MSQRRAQIGGEIGANGEFYEGGKFIATKDNAKKHKPYRRPTGRQEVAPFVWEVLPENTVALFPRLSGLFKFDRANSTFSVDNPAANFYQEHKAHYDNLISLWNSGVRWTPTVR